MKELLLNTDHEFKPVGEVLGGLEIKELPRGLPVEAVVMIKCFDDDGSSFWVTRYTKDLHAVEALGAASTAKVLLERDIVESYIPHDEEDDE